ncbi:MAG: linear amide C-N hydrolase, partial [Isosphaeraceae bacterium]
MHRTPRALAILMAVVLPGWAWPALGCTGITIKGGDGSVIFARTLEFAVDIRSEVLVVPRGRDHVGSTPAGGPGLRWRSRYASVGMNACGQPFFVDGLNEKGLHVGVFYFPAFAGYQAVAAADEARALAPHELAGFLLGTCADAGEAVEAARGVRVGPVVFKEFGFVPPVHFIVTDAAGRSMVLEHVGGEL